MDGNLSKISENLGSLISAITADGFYPVIRTISGPSTEPIVIADGKKVVLFCSSGYLGLANHPVVKAAAIDAIHRYGLGTNGSGLISGYLDIHRELEQAIAEFMGTESALVYTSVTAANAGVITSVVDPPLKAIFPALVSTRSESTAVFCDMEIHASLVEACKLCHKDKMFPFHHNDMEHLEKLLKRSKHEVKLVIVDGYYSMTAGLAPLPKITELAKENNAMVLVDDAHATGLYGANGRGTVEHFGLEGQIDLQIGSLSKVPGGMGGFVTGDKKLMDYLRVSSKSYVFTATLPAAMAGGVIASLKIIREEPWRRMRLFENTSYVRDAFQTLGLDIVGEGHIVPWLIGDEMKAAKVANDLFESGIFAPCLRYPAVHKGKALIRFMMMATHEREHLDRLIDACNEASKRHGV